MVFLTPTPLNSTDLQFGQCADAIFLPISIHSEPVFADEPVPMAALFRTEPAEPCTVGPWPGPCVARLASRAALISSGVLKSGSDTFTFSFARATWRLCRFNNLLSIDTSRSFGHPRSLNRLVAAPRSSYVFTRRPAWRFSPLGSCLFRGSAILRVQAHIIFAERQSLRPCSIIAVAPLQKIAAQ